MRAILVVITFAQVLIGQAPTEIRGTVTDIYGAVIAGAEVAATNGSRRVAKTDNAGNFVLKGLEPGAYVVEISEAGFKSITKNVALEIGGSVGLGQIQLSIATGSGLTVCAARTLTMIFERHVATPEIVGRVMSTPNVPTRRLRLTLSTPGSAELIKLARVDKEGSFKLSNLSPGEYDLLIQARGSSDFLIRGVIVKPGTRSHFLERLKLSQDDRSSPCNPIVVFPIYITL